MISGLFRSIRSNGATAALRIFVAIVVFILLCGTQAAAYDLSSFSSKFTLQDIMPGADRLEAETGNPPSAAAYRDDELLGYVFLNSAAVNATGYSGKPIHVVAGIDLNGIITGAKLVKHHEPIVLVGIPIKKITDFIDKYIGLNILNIAKTGKSNHDVDIVSGATVTVMIIDDTIIRAGIKVARDRGVGGLNNAVDTGPRELTSIKPDIDETLDWNAMLGDGSIRRMTLSVGDVNDAFNRAGKQNAASLPESENPEDIFIDLYIASAAIPSVAHSLLGDNEYKNLLKKLKPGQTAILVAGNGPYSFKGSGYVRGGIFDRIQLIQGDNNARFRDRVHKRLGDFVAEGAPRFREIALFIIPEDIGFEPASPWRLELLVNRAVGPIKKEFITFDLGYQPPEKYIIKTPIGQADTDGQRMDEQAPANGAAPLWQKIWLSKIPEITILVLALGVLTGVFFFQNWLVKRPVLTDRVRTGFLIFTVVFLGFYTHAQLSIVNVLTFISSLMHDFSWDFFLMDPLIFILWASVALSLLFWGRGVYCGWLCPFGALQELLNRVAKFMKIPQLKLPWGLHERLWPFKYIFFLGLFGISLNSFEMAERFAEIEPFKTAIILNFMREWPYVLYAVVLLVIGLFIERFFCRYICPLGGALAAPGKLSINEWLRRHKECGAPCHRCASECMVEAIHPNGKINPNECMQCLHCQTLYYDEHRCPPIIQRRLKRERRAALSTKPQPETGIESSLS